MLAIITYYLYFLAYSYFQFVIQIKQPYFLVKYHLEFIIFYFYFKY